MNDLQSVVLSFSFGFQDESVLSPLRKGSRISPSSTERIILPCALLDLQKLSFCAVIRLGLFYGDLLPLNYVARLFFLTLFFFLPPALFISSV